MLVSPALSSSLRRYRDGYFSGREQADAALLTLEGANTIDKVGCGVRGGPVVTSVIDGNMPTKLFGTFAGGDLKRRAVEENGPVRSGKDGIARLRSFTQRPLVD